MVLGTMPAWSWPWVVDLTERSEPAGLRRPSFVAGLSTLPATMEAVGPLSLFGDLAGGNGLAGMTVRVVEVEAVVASLALRVLPA